MATGKAIRLEAGRILRREDRDVLWELVNSGTATASLTDLPNLGSTRFSSQEFQDRWLRESDGSAAAPDGEKSYARSLVPSTGVLSNSPSWTAALANADPVEMWKDVDPDDVDRARDRGLTQLCVRMRLVPLTMAIDGDFVVNDGISAAPAAWSETRSTVRKYVEEDALEGFSERGIQISCSADDGFAQQIIECHDDEQWFVYTVVQADQGTAELRAFDADAAAYVSMTGLNRSTSANEWYNVMRGTFTTGATCERFFLRFGGQLNTDLTNWQHMALYPVKATEFVLPARIVSRTQIGRFVEVIGNEYPEQIVRPLGDQPKIIDVGGGKMRVVFRQAVGARAIFYEEYANYDALQTVYNTAAGRQSGDTAVTTCPLEYAAWATVEELFPGDFTERWNHVRRQHAPPKTVRVLREYPEMAQWPIAR